MADKMVSAERDSRKDEAVVFIFIVATVGLLGWAAIRPWVAKWYEVCLPPSSSKNQVMPPNTVLTWRCSRAQKARERRDYIPVAAGDH